MITPEQREARRKYIGSSDAAAICGVDPYRTAADVWLEKTGRVVDFEGNEATDRGTLLEPAILAWAEKEIGHKFVRGFMKSHPNGVLAANFDGIEGSALPPCVIEAKSTVNADEYGDAGTDQVPERVNVQSHFQLYVAGDDYRLVYVPVLMPAFKRFDFKLYRIDRNDELAQVIAERCIRFHERYIKTDTRPDDFAPSLEVLKRVRRQPNKIVSVPSVLILNAKAQRDALKKQKEACESADALLLGEMGDAEAAECETGDRVTYLETHRAGYEVKPTTYRSLKFPKVKAIAPAATTDHSTVPAAV